MEWIIACDEDGNHKTSRSREEVHQRGMWHKVVQLWAYDGNALYLQKRSHQTEVFPDCIDCFVAGHIRADETSMEALIRETKEEADYPSLSIRYSWQEPIRKHIVIMDCGIGRLRMFI